MSQTAFSWKRWAKCQIAKPNSIRMKFRTKATRINGAFKCEHEETRWTNKCCNIIQMNLREFHSNARINSMATWHFFEQRDWFQGGECVCDITGVHWMLFNYLYKLELHGSTDSCYEMPIVSKKKQNTQINSESRIATKNNHHTNTKLQAVCWEIKRAMKRYRPRGCKQTFIISRFIF